MAAARPAALAAPAARPAPAAAAAAEGGDCSASRATAPAAEETVDVLRVAAIIDYYLAHPN